MNVNAFEDRHLLNARLNFLMPGEASGTPPDSQPVRHLRAAQLRALAVNAELVNSPIVTNTTLIHEASMHHNNASSTAGAISLNRPANLSSRARTSSSRVNSVLFQAIKEP